MAKLVFRSAESSDLPAIVAMLADDVRGAGREDPSLPLDEGYLAAFEAIRADPLHSLIVAEQGGKAVGVLQLSLLPGLSWKGGWRGQIEDVRIVSDRRGRGLGAAMVRWAVEHCRERGCKVVQLTAHQEREDAQRFYERLGFAGVRRGYRMEL